MGRKDNIQHAMDSARYALRNHRMTIERDDGVFRCIYFGAPGTGIYSFRLTTWPGYLAISGDCDDFMFRRSDDMFGFFRSHDGSVGKISFDYWAEKCTSPRRPDLHTFSQDAFRDALRDSMRGTIEGCRLNFPEARRFVSEVREELWDFDSDSVIEAVNAAHLFGFTRNRSDILSIYPFTEIYEYDLSELRFGFLWACYAIQWGVKRYDLAKAGNTQADHDRRVLAGVL